MIIIICIGEGTFKKWWCRGQPHWSRGLASASKLNFNPAHVIQKTGTYVVKIHTNNTHTKFQSNILIFGYVIVKKPGKVDAATFLNPIFAFLFIVRKNEFHF